MNDLATALVSGLLRTTLALSATFAVASVLLRLLSSTSPAVHRAVWIIVLAQGWLFVGYGVNIPWHESAKFQPHAATNDALLETSTLPPLSPDLANAGEMHGSTASNYAIEKAAPADNFVGNWQFILAICWLAGCLAVALRWIVAYWRFCRHLPLGNAPLPEDETAWRQLLAERKVGQAIPMRTTDVVGPVLCRVPGGYRLFVPCSLWTELSAEARLAVLRHELAHYERSDVWWSLAARIWALPHWFNPFAWRAVQRFDEAAEWACDDEVRRADPESTLAFGKALLSLTIAPATQGLLNTAAQGRGLALRMRRIVASQVPEDSFMKKACLLGVSLVLLLAGGARVHLIARDDAGKESNSARTAGPAQAEAATAMLEAAKKAYEATAAGYDAGTAPLPDLYVWSRRWLEAERNLAKTLKDQRSALMQHWDRMSVTHRKVAAMYFAGSKGGEVEKYYATKFYLAEAEMWLAQAGGDAPSGDE
jgi:beta-lactamase regulating signal transducer with metallopeptidase domain